MKLTIQKPNKYLALSFAIPATCFMVLQIIAGCQPFHSDKSMLYSDMFHQYYPFFVAFRKALLSGESLLWNWSVGMGMDYLGLFAYYLASPLNLVTVLLPESWMMGYFALLTPIKLGLASLFFAIFLKNTFGKNDWSLAFFGGLYGLCSWALGYQWNIMWLDTFALLPLVVLGTLKLLRERKFVLYTLTLFLSVYANYYIGFFTCIFVLLVCVCYEICHFSSFKRLLADVGVMAFFSLLAIGMTAFVTLPAYAALQNTQSSVNLFPDGFQLNMTNDDTWKGLLDAMRQVAGNFCGGVVPTFKEGLPNVHCGVGTMVFAFLFLFNREVKIREKICAVLLLLFFMVSFIIRQLDYIWHGFHFTNMIPYRFSFLASFVLLYMAYRTYVDLAKYPRWSFAAAGVLYVGLMLCSDQLSKPVFLVYNLVLLVLYVGSLLYGKVRIHLSEDATADERAEARTYFLRHRRTCAAALAMIAGAELVLATVNFGVNFSYTSVYNYPNGTTSTADVIEFMKEREKDTLFYRAETTHSQTLNDGALNGYDGVSTFTSSANVNVTQFMKALGYGAKNTYNRYCFEEASPVSNLFLNLKYMIERDGDVEENSYFDPVYVCNDVYLLENNAYLPLGFLAEKSLGRLNFTQHNDRFLFQNELFTAATGLNQGSVWKEVYPKVTTQCVTLTSSKNGRVTYKECQDKAYVIFTYEINRAGFFCLDLDLSQRNGYHVYKNGEYLYSEGISLQQMIAVSEVAPGDKIEVKVKCANGERGTMDVTGCVLDDAMFRQGVDILSASTLELTEFSTTVIEGTINCNRDGLLYTSVPLDGNWVAYVDGEIADIDTVGGCMISLDMTKGTHTVRLEYHNKSFNTGLTISIVCFGVFTALAVCLLLRKKQHGKFAK